MWTLDDVQKWKVFEGFDFHCPCKSLSRTCLETIVCPNVPPTPKSTHSFIRALNMFGVLCWLKACTMASLLTLVLNVAVARVVSWQGCDYETFFPVLGGEKLTRPWYSPDSRLHHAAPGTARLGRLHNEAQDACTFAAKTATPYLL